MARTPAVVFGYLEALLVLALGAYMTALAGSSVYWMLLNPAFKPLTLAGGVGIALAGLAGLAWPRAVPLGPGRLARLAALGVVLACIFLGQGRALFTVSPLGEDVMDYGQAPTSFSAPAVEEVEARESWEGAQYIRLNLAELFNLSQAAGAAPLAPEAAAGYVLRGQVLRTPELDARGQVALVRLSVFCCLADAVGFALLLDMDDPAVLEHGSWLKAFVALRPEAVPPELENAASHPDAFFTSLVPNHAARPVRLEAIRPPDIPYIFAIHAAEPYAY